jgi:hypothetical protein
MFLNAHYTHAYIPPPQKSNFGKVRHSGDFNDEEGLNEETESFNYIT